MTARLRAERCAPFVGADDAWDLLSVFYKRLSLDGRASRFARNPRQSRDASYRPVAG